MYSRAELSLCRAALKGGSRSFHAAAKLLPRRIAEPAAVLYAFCREADDLVDEGGGARALRALHVRLARLHAGSAVPARDALLADLLTRHQIPCSVLEGLLDGFAWDVQGRRYLDIQDLLAYAMRVAGTVGLAMALVMGARGRPALRAAAALGIAMQLTNICRDVGDDARLGRLYLPRRWLEEAGINPEAWLRTPTHSPALAQVIARVLDLADAFYALGDAGLAALPADCRGGIRAARKLYAEIGHTLRRAGCDPLAGRTVVGPWQKFLCLIQPLSPVANSLPSAWVELACEAAAGSFLDALPPALLSVRPPGAGEVGRVVWVLDLFERLERRSMALRSAEGDLQA